MSVTLIEIKGSDFFLVNQGGYEKLASKVEEAAGQLRERIGYVNRNYEQFRRKVHEIRKSVEAGKSIYNSLLGPKGGLQVDADKDINIYGVLICGRTRDDLKESIKRQDFEYNIKPSIKLESWDTWLRKLSRQ